MTADEARDDTTSGKVDAPATGLGTALRGLVPPVSGFGLPIGCGLFGAPSWVVCVLGALGFAVFALQIVFPQESADRLAWWRDRRRSRERVAARRAEAARSEDDRPW
ncbi:hypothetical protein OG417_09535 [Actinoallomurus sp. NBC_01490]|uniref:hypothetical protein n=1 Tax=Actinoallomurus sp. NBC_01490 TaxID=2903557 RepID=UPI002E376872|nr:hypothetical protein [Actinoallomurus sp. NBC_01490]